MATVHLDTARLRQLLVFERTLRSLSPSGCSPEQTARAHAAAVNASGMLAGDVEAPLALLRRFAANRALRARLWEGLPRLEAAGDKEALEQARARRTRIAELDAALLLREESETRAVLEAHEEEILALFASGS